MGAFFRFFLRVISRRPLSKIGRLWVLSSVSFFGLFPGDRSQKLAVCGCFLPFLSSGYFQETPLKNWPSVGAFFRVISRRPLPKIGRLWVLSSVSFFGLFPGERSQKLEFQVFQMHESNISIIWKIQAGNTSPVLNRHPLCALREKVPCWRHAAYKTARRLTESESKSCLCRSLISRKLWSFSSACTESLHLALVKHNGETINGHTHAQPHVHAFLAGTLRWVLLEKPNAGTFHGHTVFISTHLSIGVQSKVRGHMPIYPWRVVAASV